MIEILKSDKILNKDNSVWYDLLIAAEFPKEFLNIGAEYCNYHNTEEAKFISKSDKDISTMVLGLKLLSKLDLNKFEKIYISDDIENKTFEYITEGVGAPIRIIEDIDNVFIDDIADKINNKNGNTLKIGILFNSVAVIREAVFDSKVIIKCKYEKFS